MSDTLFAVKLVRVVLVVAALTAVILLVASGDTSSLSNLPSEGPIGDFPELPLYL